MLLAPRDLQFLTILQTMFVMSYDDFEIYEQMNEKEGLDDWILFWAYFCVYVLVMIFSIATKRKRMLGNIGSSKVDFSWSQETWGTETNMQSKLWRSWGIALKIALIFRCDPFHHHKLFSRQRSRKFCQVKFKLDSLDNGFFVVVALRWSLCDYD